MRVLHLLGSPTDAFFDDLSRLYAADCLGAVADPARYEPVVAHVAPDGSWRFPVSVDGDALDAATLDAATLAATTPVTLEDALARLRREHIDVAVPQLFCRAGMTTYRALLDLLGIPFVGNRAEVMAIGADKAWCKAVVSAGGVDVAAGDVLGPGQRPTRPLPVVVKPVDADNSAGVSLVRDDDELDAALRAAFEHSSRVLVEDYVELGREVRCGVLERDGELVVLPLEEYAVDPHGKPIRDGADKLVRGADGNLALVAKDAAHAWIVAADDPATEAVGRAARAAHRALGARHYSLFDFRIDPAGRPWFLEAGLYCSFARSSVVAVMAAAAGIPLEQLFADAIGAAVLSAPPGRSG